MRLQIKIEEKEQILQQVVKEMDTRKEEVSKITAEINQLETQGILIQGAILAYKEIMEEDAAEVEAKAKEEAAKVKEEEATELPAATVIENPDHL